MVCLSYGFPTFCSDVLFILTNFNVLTIFDSVPYGFNALWIGGCCLFDFNVWLIRVCVLEWISVFGRVFACMGRSGTLA